MAKFNEDVLITGTLSVDINLEGPYAPAIVAQVKSDQPDQASVHVRNYGTGPSVLGWNTSGGGQGQLGVNTTVVLGTSETGDAVLGRSSSNDHAGVSGINIGNGFGVWASSQGGDAVQGNSASDEHAGVAAHNSAKGPGLWAFSRFGDAGHFEGNVSINGNLTIGQNKDIVFADCAEPFRVAEGIMEPEPGTVMTLNEIGAICPSHKPYDKRAIGVVSGAGTFRSAIVLGGAASIGVSSSIALVGQVYCKADAAFGSIEVGDLLTTSPTLGHAMKAVDPAKALGAVIGKALESVAEGCALIRILVPLQ